MPVGNPATDRLSPVAPLPRSVEPLALRQPAIRPPPRRVTHSRTYGFPPSRRLVAAVSVSLATASTSLPSTRANARPNARASSPRSAAKCLEVGENSAHLLFSQTNRRGNRHKEAIFKDS